MGFSCAVRLNSLGLGLSLNKWWWLSVWSAAAGTAAEFRPEAAAAADDEAGLELAGVGEVVFKVAK